MSPRARESGFSAIEALAALAILAVAMLPLLSLQTQIARDAARQDRAHTLLVDEQNALALLRDLNPMATPTGTRTAGASAVQWRATLASDIRPAATGAAFEVALYDVEILVEHADGASSRMQVEKLGWRPLAAPSN